MQKENEFIRPINPCSKSIILNYIFYGWTKKIFNIGHKRDIQLTDLYEPLEEHSSGHLGDKFAKIWNVYLKTGVPSLAKTIFQSFKRQIIINFLVTLFIECGIKVAQPIFLGKMVSYYVPGQTNISERSLYLYALGVVLCSIFNVFLNHPCGMSITHLCMKYRIGCCSLIYRKALRLSKTALSQTTIGQVVNLLSNDVGRFDVATILMNYLFIAPIQLFIMAFLMWFEIGISALIGVLVLILAIPFQLWLGKMVKSIRSKTAKLTDNRLRLINEILLGIHVIKMYTWEKPFGKMMEYARRKEMNNIKKTSYIRGIVTSFGMINSRFAMFTSILAYVLLGNIVTAEKIFVVMSYYSALRHSLTVLFPRAITMLAEIKVTIKRLQTFLLYSETDIDFKRSPSCDLSEIELEMFSKSTNASINEETKIPFLGDKDFKEAKIQWGNKVTELQNYSYEDSNDNIAKPPVESTFASYENLFAKTNIEMKKAYVKWNLNQANYTLNNITLNIEPGSLVAIVGPVGSGKTSLFFTILKEVSLHSGKLIVNGSVSYASQEPWLFDNTVVQNITFGDDMDNFKYRTVLKACALEEDLAQLSHADKTLVGERGVILSGGQKSRINLARAVYKDADIYLLDDPLSAVDSHVGKHIFNECIMQHLKGKTRLLITHQPEYLNEVDHIIMLDNGYIVAEGSYDELLDNNNDFKYLLQSQKEYSSEDVEKKSIDISENNLRNRFSTEKSVSLEVLSKDKRVEEKRTKGSVSRHVYKAYIMASGSIILFIILLILILLTQFFASGMDLWIGYWVNMEETNGLLYNNLNLNSTNVTSLNSTSETILEESSSLYNINDTISFSANDSSLSFDSNIGNFYPAESFRALFVIIYAGLAIALVIVAMSRSLMFYWMATRASIKLHNQMFKAISYAKMYFFHSNPSGRILNRFSKDMGIIDETVPSVAMEVIQSTLNFFGIIIVIVIVNYWLVIPTVIMLVVFGILQVYYLSTSRSLKRLEGTARSPIFSHLSSTLQGMTTIRAFGAQSALIKEFDEYQDSHSSTWFISIGTARAFGLWLDSVCLVYIVMVTLSFLFFTSDSLAGNVGLAISQAIGLTGMIQWGVRQSTELENYMTSVERILEYHNETQEFPLETKKDESLIDWPFDGHIQFTNVSFRYTRNGNPVLENISFSLQRQEKMGIVGRTGSGKSSLVNALFRLAYVGGKIEIDGVDTGRIGLNKLRSKLSIIPQEPILFSGTVRQNIDPFGDNLDDVLWKVLEQVKLKNVIASLPHGLDATVIEGGSNFSMGQRQLLCLARALIRDNKILVLDEATASIDPQTDDVIQKTIREKFSHCTILTIAHRLQTIMDSDKILVLDSGKVIEFDHPYVLLQNENSMFYNMVKQMKKETSDSFLSIAKKNYEVKYPMLRK